MISIDLAGESVRLLPERALWWPRESTLFIADAHFGKAAAFRAAGVPVPEAANRATLDRIKDLCQRLPVSRIVFLGDFIHHRTGWAAATGDALTAWRAQHHALAITLVRGNHDRHGGDPPTALRIECVDAPQSLGPFTLLHEPTATPRATGYGLAGHIHPAIVLSGRANQRLRLPCFWSNGSQMVLPAFGEFTGSATITPNGGDRIFAVTHESVLEIRR